MPRQENRKQDRKSLQATGRRISAQDYRIASTAEQWQAEAWRLYDIVGEFRFAAGWVGNLLSRATLHVLKDGKPVPETDPAAVLFSGFFGSDQGRSQMLRSAGIHYTVPGEMLMVSYEEGGKDVWETASPKMVTKSGSTWSINGVKHEIADPLQIRTWDPHPANPEKATSPARSALPILAEIERLTMHVAATVDSRLASAGILFVPNEMAVASTTDGDKNTKANADTLIQELMKVAQTSIRDRGDASALVPIVITADADAISAVKHLSFSSVLDEQAIALRSEAIRRLALSMDMPPEVLLGTGDANHWSAAQVDEAAIKSHTEPLLLRICADITSGFLVPGLELDGMDAEEARTYEVHADTSKIRLRPNRSKEAFELYDRGYLKGTSLLRETGFDEADIPDDKERQFFLAWKMASGSATPEMVAEANKILGLKIEALGTDPNESRPDPSLKEHPERLLQPDRNQSEKRAERKAMNAAAEQMVFRALERCGNKMKTRLKFSQEGIEPAESYLFHQVPEGEVAFMLEGSFSQVDRFKWNVDPAELTVALGEYCRSLILTQTRHTPTALARVLDSLEVVDV